MLPLIDEVLTIKLQLRSMKVKKNVTLQDSFSRVHEISFFYKTPYLHSFVFP